MQPEDIPFVVQDPMHISLVHNNIYGLFLSGFPQPPQDASSKKGSEMLPAGWNESEDVYHLVYIQSASQAIFLLKIIRMDDSLLVHLMVSDLYFH